jgi:hypothetical protein
MENYWKTMAEIAKLYSNAPYKSFYIDAANGGAGRAGDSPDKAVISLEAGYAFLTDKKNDSLVIIGDGATTGTVRLTAAMIWAKSQCRLVGRTAPTLFSSRARIAPAAATTAFANFLALSGSGNVFENIAIVQDFTTDGDNQIALTISGHRNVFKNCHIYGIAKGSDAGGRCLKIAAGEENLFEDCVIGVDTITRSAANASIEFSAGAARNVFRRCILPFHMSAGTPLAVKVAAAAGSDRFQLFEDCSFINAVGSGSTTMTALCTLAAAMGGVIVFRNCTLVGITGFGSDATSRGQIYIEGGTPAAASTGLAVAPTA